MVSWRGRAGWAAVAVAWCASWWLLWALAALLVGDTLRVLIDSTGLADAVDAELTVGLSWTLVLALSAVLLGWSAAVISDRRPARARRGAQGTTGWPALSPGGVPSPALPAPRRRTTVRRRDPFAPEPLRGRVRSVSGRPVAAAPRSG